MAQRLLTKAPCCPDYKLSTGIYRCTFDTAAYYGDQSDSAEWRRDTAASGDFAHAALRLAGCPRPRR